MSRTLTPSTPCPATASNVNNSHVSLNRIAAYDIPGDTTANIEYTRAFQPSLRGTKPRRSSIFPRKATETAPVTIFEDLLEEEESPAIQTQTQTRRAVGKTLLSKPARKMAPATAAGSVQQAREPKQTHERPEYPAQQRPRSGLQEICQGKARMSLASREDGSRKVGQQQQQQQQQAAGGAKQAVPSDTAFPIKKEPRRRTIFIPDDTTVLTIHPGARNMHRIDDTFQLPSFVHPPDQQNDAEDRDEPPKLRAPVRRPRKSLAVAPKRMPLQALHSQENYQDQWDVCGDNTGKENLPPSGEKLFKASRERRETLDIVSRLRHGTAATHARQSLAPRNEVPVNRNQGATIAQQSSSGSQFSTTTLSSTTSHGGRTSVSPSQRNQRQSTSDGSRLRPSPTIKAADTQEKQQLRKLIAQRRAEQQNAKVKDYPVLSENLAQTMLYEDDWLLNQEVSLSEVINQIFNAAAPVFADGLQAVRATVIDLYHQPEIVLLFKRLQASLAYGALSQPKTATGLPNLCQDLALRKRFILLFTESYDHRILRLAAEVVVGRQIPSHTSGAPNNMVDIQRTLDPRADGRALIAFLETFFVHVSDLDSFEDSAVQSLDVLRWRKTMLRSFMLVWLLDEVRTSGFVKGNLFRSTSNYKSSESVLLELGSMLMPFVGDISRVLKQMDFEVTQAQDPLDEVTYRIDNLAVDLRDGVALTHLVEILLYSRQVCPTGSYDDDATISITLPDATVLLSDYYKCGGLRNTYMLSQHLKMPCLGRAQKLFNAQVALSALESYDILAANVAGDVTADDIVNGHREKTLSLLWSLVSVYGLNHLIDWKDLCKDIHRISGSAPYILPNPNREDQDSLLLAWASAHSAKTGNGSLKNLTTSFASGAAYVAIIDGFAEYIPSGKDARSIFGDRSVTLTRQLQALGCSKAFTTQLTSKLGMIPSREVTVSNLAFLASRLLPFIRNHNAAVTIQVQFRKKRFRIVASQRIKLMRLARDCAIVVQTGQRMTSSAEVIQRAWRSVLASRINKLNLDVLVFQTLARGQATRKYAKRSLKAGRYTTFGNEAPPQARVMGGW